VRVRGRIGPAAREEEGEGVPGGEEATGRRVWRQS